MRKIKELRLEHLKWQDKYNQAKPRSKARIIAEFKLKEIMTELLKLQIDEYQDEIKSLTREEELEIEQLLRE